jgi:hypothetical protein
MQKSFYTLVFMLLFGISTGFAQSYVVSGIEKTDKEEMQYEVLGKIGTRYWIFKKNGNISTIAQYNDQMQMVKQNDLPFLPATVNSIEFIKQDNKLIAFYQFQAKTTLYAAAAILDAEGQLMGSPKIVDTVEKIRPGSGAKIFNLVQSDDHSKIALFTVNTTKASNIKVKVLSLNSQFEISNEASISVSSLSKKSNLSDFAIDNAGNLFCLRNTTQQNAAPAVSLLFLAASGTEVVETPVINNNFLLDDIRLKIDNQNARILLNSFYATNKKGNIEGLFSYIWDINTRKEIALNANRFTDANRAAISTKRNLKDAFDTYYIDKVNPQADGSFTVISEAAETYSNRSAFSRWDYFYGGAFYNPFMFNYWNRPFGFYPWSRFGYGFGMGWGFGGPWMNPYAGFGYNSVTYTAGKVAMINFDAKGNLQWIKTIDKSQSDQNIDQFIGYGTLQNSNGLNFVHYEKSRGIHSLAVNTLTPNSQLAKGASIILQDKNFEWMPRSLKQVGDNEAILPYQFKNKIGFAKIQFK